MRRPRIGLFELCASGTLWCLAACLSGCGSSTGTLGSALSADASESEAASESRGSAGAGGSTDAGSIGGSGGAPGTFTAGPNGVPDPSCIQGNQCSSEGARCTSDSYDCSWCNCTGGHYVCAAYDVAYCGLSPAAENTPREGDACSFCIKGGVCRYECGGSGADTKYQGFTCGQDLKWHLTSSCAKPAPLTLAPGRDGSLFAPAAERLYRWTET